MKYLRPDTRVIGLGAIDRNDPEHEREAVQLSLPADFSEKARACWEYFEGAAFLFEYKGRLVMTDESLYLTDHGDGTRGAPYGGPRATFDNWPDVEKWLEAVADELSDWIDV